MNADGAAGHGDGPRPAPVVSGSIGELFHLVADAVLILEGPTLVACNPPGLALLGLSADAGVEAADAALRPVLAALREVPTAGPPQRLTLEGIGVLDVTRREVGGREVFVLADRTADVRQVEGLRRLAALGPELLTGTAAVGPVLQRVATEAKALTGGAYSAVLLLREGSATEISHFVYDAPRHLFPARMPRAVGLLAVPLASGLPARLDDIRGHAAGVGLPGVHPPIGPLIAVPLVAGDAVVGELAVANPPGGRAFDVTDEVLLGELASHTATAVRWAQAGEADREQQALRQEVVDTARHDVRTPLGAGKGYALLLSRRLDAMTPEQVRTALDGVVGAFERIEAFTERLLLDERSETAGVEPEWGEVDLARLLDDVRRDAAVLQGRDDAVLVDLDPGLPHVCAGDAGMVREVLDNLVSNAVKHAPGSPVRVTVRPEGDHLRVDVRDEGPGIAEEEQTTLFERWSRGAESRRLRTPGLGLGLAIVRRLVTAHGGLLGVSSRPGEGATFWVTFPRERPASGPDAP